MGFFLTSSMERGVSREVEGEELLYYSTYPWQGFQIFSDPKPSMIASPATVQVGLEQLSNKTEARFYEIPLQPFPGVEGGAVGFHAVRKLSTSRGASTFTLF